MPKTLGEKLREAREEKGISASEVAEQTRISPLYISSIEKNDYKFLPGGIFNKGFVKSYAKLVGLDEHEALQDYANLISQTEGISDEPQSKYRPEVLTDDNTISSMIPTIIFAGIILAVMTGGILFVVNYLQKQPETPIARSLTNSANTNVQISTEPTPAVSNVPAMSALKIDFKANSDEVSLTSTSDGKKAVALVTSGSTVSFEPKESLKLRYSKSLVQSAQLLINGKSIELPQLAQPGRSVIELDINKDNLARIWESGRISFDAPAVSPTPTTSVTSESNQTATQTESPNVTTKQPHSTTQGSTPKTSTPEPLPTRRVIVEGNTNRL